jgi:hypothetical protein
MKVQALAAIGVGDVILDFVCGDRSIAQITRNSCTVTRIDVYREHERQSAILDALQRARA